MSVKVMSAVWDHSRASGTPLIVLLCLADWANDDGECWPSIASIVRKARLKDERHVKRVIHDTLERDLGEVVVIPGGGTASSKGGLRSNRYRITVHLPDEALMVAEQPLSAGDDGGSPATQIVAEQPPLIVAEQPPEPSVEPSMNRHSLSLVDNSSPDDVKDPRDDDVVRQALSVIAERIIRREKLAGRQIRNIRAYRATVLANATDEYGDEIAKRHADNPAFTAEDLAGMFEPDERLLSLDGVQRDVAYL